MPLDVAALLNEMSLAEKASLTSGSGFWYTAPIERLGVPKDPYLAGELGVGIVDGIQAHGVGTSVKHYAANNQETDRLRVDARIDERTRIVASRNSASP